MKLNPTKFFLFLTIIISTSQTVKKLSFMDKIENNQIEDYLDLLDSSANLQNAKFIINQEKNIKDSIKISLEKKIDIFQKNNITLYEIPKHFVLNEDWAKAERKDIYQSVISKIKKQGKLTIFLF